MGACGSKPKVLGDKVRRSPQHLTSNTLQSFSSAGQPSFRDNPQSVSLSAAPDVDKATALSRDDKTSLSFAKAPADTEQKAVAEQPQEEEDSDPIVIVANESDPIVTVGNDSNPIIVVDNDSDPIVIVGNDSDPIVIVGNDSDRRDELPANHNSGYDDHNHDIPLEYTTEDESDDTISEDGQNGVVEEPKLKDEVDGPAPTEEADQIPNTSPSSTTTTPIIHDIKATSPAGLQPPPPHTSQNDVVTETLLTPAAAPVPQPQNDVVIVDEGDEETSSSSDAGGLQNENENDVAEEASRPSPPGSVTLTSPRSSSSMAHHKSKEVLGFDHLNMIDIARPLHEAPSPVVLVHHAGPTYHQHSGVRDHRVANKAAEGTEEQRATFVTSNSNAMPSTFAF